MGNIHGRRHTGSSFQTRRVFSTGNITCDTHEKSDKSGWVCDYYASFQYMLKRFSVWSSIGVHIWIFYYCEYLCVPRVHHWRMLGTVQALWLLCLNGTQSNLCTQIIEDNSTRLCFSICKTQSLLLGIKLSTLIKVNAPFWMWTFA